MKYIIKNDINDNDYFVDNIYLFLYVLIIILIIIVINIISYYTCNIL